MSRILSGYAQNMAGQPSKASFYDPQPPITSKFDLGPWKVEVLALRIWET